MEVEDSTTSISKVSRYRNISVDSGIHDVSDSSNLPESDSATETDSFPENGTADRAIVYHKKSETAYYSSASFNQSSDPDFSRSISQEYDFRGHSCLSEKPSVTEDACYTDGQLQAAAEGEDYPDFIHENVASQTVQGFYSSLVEVICNQVTVDRLASDLYSHSLIENTVLEEMRVQSISDIKKTQQVLGVVMSKLRTSQSKFEDFMDVLDSYDPCRDLVEQMKAKYGHQQLQQSSDVSKQANKRDNIQEQPSSSSSQVEKYAVNLSQSPTSCAYNSVSYLLTIYSPFAISLFLVITLLLLYSHLIVLRWTLNADMKVEKMHPSSAFDEKIAMYIEVKQQLEEQLLVAQRQILQLNREVLDLKKTNHHSFTHEPKMSCEKRMQRLEEEKMDYVAIIENLKQQRDLLLNG